MTRFRLLFASAALAAILAAPAVALAEAPPGDVILDMRLRTELVDQDGFGKGAVAVTLRTRFGYETPAFGGGFKVLVEGENVAALVDDYSSSTNAKVRYPLVTDPEDTELNRAQISWTGAQGDVVVGRQRLILGNARFVGNVGFRQNEQTFDAARATFRPAKDLTLTYAYIDRVHRIFGDDHPLGEFDSDSHLIQADLKTPIGAVTGYGNLLEFQNAPLQSNATFGARLVGARPLAGGRTVTYEAEFARQEDYRNNPQSFDLTYVALSAGLRDATRWLSVGYERLDGDGRRGFATPLATLHAFQGWADVFLTTPPGGVRDLNLRAGANLKGAPLKLAAAVHHFADDDGSRRYGQELDLLASLALTKAITAEAKAAFFDGSRPQFPDRTKVWLTLEFKY